MRNLILITTANMERTNMKTNKSFYAIALIIAPIFAGSFDNKEEILAKLSKERLFSLSGHNNK